MGLVGWLPAALGFAAGGVFLYGLDHLLPHLHLEEKQPEGLSTNWKKTTLLVSAVTPVSYTHLDVYKRQAGVCDVLHLAFPDGMRGSGIDRVCCLYDCLLVLLRLLPQTDPAWLAFNPAQEMCIRDRVCKGHAGI